MTHRFIGVDGGISGAIAIVATTGAVSVFDIPSVERQVGARKRNVFDPGAYLELLHSLGLKSEASPVRLALFERGGEIPFVDNQGRRKHQSGMYAYGFTNGQMIMGVRALDVWTDIVEPQTWKRHFHLLGKDKEASRAKASELYPYSQMLWKNKGHHNRAEAVLIARYAMDTPA